MSLEIKNLKSGQRVFECEGGRNAELIIVSEPRRVENKPGWSDGWEIDATYKGEPVHLFCADGAGCYGPKLYNKKHI